MHVVCGDKIDHERRFSTFRADAGYAINEHMFDLDVRTFRFGLNRFIIVCCECVLIVLPHITSVSCVVIKQITNADSARLEQMLGMASIHVCAI